MVQVNAMWQKDMHNVHHWFKQFYRFYIVIFFFLYFRQSKRQLKTLILRVGFKNFCGAFKHIYIARPYSGPTCTRVWRPKHVKTLVTLKITKKNTTIVLPFALQSGSCGQDVIDKSTNPSGKSDMMMGRPQLGRTYISFGSK